jgi:FAD/FMN-containing dehydrogenase
MTFLDGLPIAQLRSSFRGELVGPNDSRYDAARSVWNGMVDKRPALIAYCADAGDVIEALHFCVRQNQVISVRAGGHNAAGLSVADNGVVIDVSRMKRIDVDGERRTARAGAGLTLGEFDAASQSVGLATTMGVNSDTGIAGLTLGGGIGKLGRAFGLSCDNLLSADIVTAEGRLLTASAEQNADLFWGLRGGGGNFGIVTAFEYRLHPVGPLLWSGFVLYDYARARDAMRFYADFSRNVPDELALDAALITEPTGERFFTVSACYNGPIDEGGRIVERLRAYGEPIEDSFAPKSYVQIQSANDATFLRGRRYYWKAHLLRELTDGAIDTLLDMYAAAPSKESFVSLQHVGGAIARIPRSATAYVNRDALYDCFPISIWDDPLNDDANVAWTRELWSAMEPYGSGGVYVNNLGDEGEDRVKAAYGENYPRLAALKSAYDPSNIFRLNQNIRPTSSEIGSDVKRS